MGEEMRMLRRCDAFLDRRVRVVRFRRLAAKLFFTRRCSSEEEVLVRERKAWVGEGARPLVG